MNAVLIAVAIMLILSLLRINVVFALLIGAIVGGLSGGLTLTDTLTSFTNGLGGGASIALSYALLGGFAIAISKTGIPEILVATILKVIKRDGETERTGLAKTFIILTLLFMAVFSQNLIPIHIAFIPLLVPPIIHVMNLLKLDRRLIASVLTFGLTAPYILLPYGFGFIFHEILATQMEAAGLVINMKDIPIAMLIPTAGLIVGLFIAVFISYRKPREYQTEIVPSEVRKIRVNKKDIIFTVIALLAALTAQVLTESMIVGALSGIIVLYVSGALKRKDSDDILIEGMRLMAFIGFVMITANGFASVIQETGDIESLVGSVSSLLEGNKALAAMLMLLIGLVITMGIGSSFATIPIIAAIFVPLAVEFGFSPLAIIALIGTAGALGDAGSPASDSTLGPTAGLNIDGQHNHIWDTCVPTFIHYNIPLLVFGWIAVMVL